MRYTKRDYLTIIEIDKNTKSISMQELKRILVKRPSNMIYCESGNRLFGIISTGDIYRAYNKGEDSVKINKEFKYVKADEYMKARTIFLEKESINALPVILENGTLIGDYTRWDDIIFFDNTFNIWKNYEDGKFYADKKVILVQPESAFVEKMRIFLLFKEYLMGKGALVKCIEYSEILRYSKLADIILVVDENEVRAWRILCLVTEGYKRNASKYFTYKDMIVNDVAFSDNQCALYLENLYNQGIHIVSLIFEDNKYCEVLQKEICDKFKVIDEEVSNCLKKPMYQAFFDDLYSAEYADAILNMPFGTENNGGILRLKDCKSRYCNIVNGERLTVDQPNKYERCVYFFGACYIYGHWVEDRNTIESFLQKQFCDNREAVKVVNFGSTGMLDMYRCMIRIMDTKLEKGDVIVIGAVPKGIGCVKYLDLNKVIEKNRVSAGWVIDCTMHCNHKVNKLYADAIYKALSPFLLEKTERQEIEIENDFIRILYLDRYFSDFHTGDYERVGAIVMNCNPFTYGHRYLIERALKTVDFLIVFVVEEDLSVFSFAERFAMVTEGVSDLENVRVVPSGPFILSKVSFPEYFIKETSEDIREHTEQDITTFAEKIAPYLGISYRFVGEELEDDVTKQYNLAMKKILPRYGIGLIEIPRKTVNGKVISASSVRRYLEMGNREKIVELLPETTRKLIGMECAE